LKTRIVLLKNLDGGCASLEVSIGYTQPNPLASAALTLFSLQTCDETALDGHSRASAGDY